jgi:protein-S-isoprenylcysteine O-methyltransferase Ste14
MIEALIVTFLPVVFMILLLGGGEVFRRKKIEQGGEAPINKALFATSKYAILVIWGATVLAGWGVGLSVLETSAVITGIALAFWVDGFTFLFLGRFGLGSSFRLGTPKESTSLRTAGLYGISRNPMYLGVYATVLASAIFTMNPLVWALGALVVCVHHRIVLAEEEHMRTAFGKEYDEYYRRVGRYIGLRPRAGSAS